MARMIAALVLLVFSAVPATASSDVISIAVASNFKATLSELADSFEQQSGHTVRLSAASTGKHYAQIVNGAPFDVFLAADAERPQELVDAGLADPETLHTYSLGTLVLWAPALDGEDCLAVLKSGEFNRLALANPRTAPYGLAAHQVLESLAIAGRYKSRLVTGENISQAMHFVDAGAAPAGFVATSHWLVNARRNEGCYWKVPTDLHEPVAQQAVMLTRAKHPAAARQFLQFLASDAAVAVIRANGYLTEDERTQ